MVSPPVLHVLMRTIPPGEVIDQSSVPPATTFEESVSSQEIVPEFWLELRSTAAKASPKPSHNPTAGDRVRAAQLGTVLPTRSMTKSNGADAI